MIVLLANSVYAFAISSPYWPDNPLMISPGQSQDFKLTLVNTAGTEDLTVIGEVSQGADITTITDSVTKYTVPAGGNKEVNLKISVPSDSPIGGNYPVIVSFKTVTSGAQGALGIGSAIDQRIPVYVVAKPRPEMNTTLYLLVGIIVLVILIIILVRRRKR